MRTWDDLPFFLSVGTERSLAKALVQQHWDYLRLVLTIRASS